ncbi:hypothetical protein [Acetobacter conturbans]|uniref:Uncharacterized protein n=1 Tax=Acetobacter conturbans TaxID=1737472 RepID=A0ABX0K1H1_9PROT|nr:hypothetical protein [Acetobacter conturbans]NHN89582.1 hypothetical protein [Acetobacter conturbans]
MPEPLSIPPVAHFITLGQTISWSHAFAIASATRVGMTNVFLHHASPLPETPQIAFLRSLASVTLRALDVEKYLRQVGAELDIASLPHLYRLSADRTVRECIVHAALIYQLGGIYLAPETLMVGPLPEGMTRQVFFGSRFIFPRRNAFAFPERVLTGLTRRLRHQRVAHGKRPVPPFAAISSVFGAVPKAPFLALWLRSLISERAGTVSDADTLLRRLLDACTDPEVVVEPPEMMCTFSSGSAGRLFSHASASRIPAMIPPSARVIHWQSCPRTRQREAEICPDHVMENAYQQLYSSLIWHHVPAVKNIVYL